MAETLYKRIKCECHKYTTASVVCPACRGDRFQYVPVSCQFCKHSEVYDNQYVQYVLCKQISDSVPLPLDMACPDWQPKEG
jgi:predicted nucleic-acid-binding Zn-ribbon protein